MASAGLATLFQTIEGAPSHEGLHTAEEAVNAAHGGGVPFLNLKLAFLKNPLHFLSCEEGGEHQGEVGNQSILLVLVVEDLAL